MQKAAYDFLISDWSTDVCSSDLVCLLAAFIPLLLFGYSINLLTLLALVLSIGLVVDDEIVVLENIQRRVDLGEPKLVAAVRGTRQVAFAVIDTTTVLVAGFLPVGFLEGNTGDRKRVE